MLSKIPDPKEEPHNETSGVNGKWVVVIVVLFVGIGLATGYTMFPLVQTPKTVIMDSNLTNNTAAYASNPTTKHTKITNSSADIQKVNNQNSTKTINTKTTGNGNANTKYNTQQKNSKSSKSTKSS